MARPQQEAIDTFMSITGASEAEALRKLEEHNGDLNEAVNAHFNEGDTVNARATSLRDAHNDFVNMEDPMDVEEELAPFPLFTAARRWNTISPFDMDFGRSLFDGRVSSESINQAPRVSHPREIREIPIDFKDGSGQSGNSMPTVEDITGSAAEHGPEVRGTVVIDDDEEDDLLVHPPSADERNNDEIHTTSHETSVLGVNNANDFNNEIEEQMITAAIEASKQEMEMHNNHAADHKEVRDEQGINIQPKGSSSSSGVILEDLGNMTTANGRQGFHQSRSGVSTRSNSDEEAEDSEAYPLVQHRSPHFLAGTDEPAVEVDPGSYSEPQNPRPEGNGNSFHSEEWGGISSVEHDEAVMLEAAMFGGIPERTAYDFHYSSRNISDRHANLYPRVPRPPSPTLAAQRLIREQQDGEYRAALQADREKELKAMEDAELRRLEEAAAIESALEEEKLQKEEAQRKLWEKEEFDRKLSAKQTSLPPEPAVDDESAVTLLVRMPDGNRSGRRFLKSDKLQSLFDFIDILRVVMPGKYRLVRPFPRRAFGEAEKDMSLSELGLTSKQEALFLELI